MGGCGCLQRAWREQVQLQMRATQDSALSMSPAIEGSHHAAVSSDEESDGESGDQGDSTVVTDPMVKSCAGIDHQKECRKCIMCAAQEVEQEFSQCGMCAACSALSVQEMTPEKVSGAQPGHGVSGDASPGLKVVAQAMAGAETDH